MLFLSDPAFVGSAFIQESLPKGNLVGDDDKIYFFFSEAGKEFDFFDNTIVSRIARVCKVSDALGQTVRLKRVYFFRPPTLKQHLLARISIIVCSMCVCVQHIRSLTGLYVISQTAEI